MKMGNTFTSTVCLLSALALPALAFEGTVTSRRISVKPAGITKLAGGNKSDAEKILKMRADQILAVKDESIEEKVTTVLIQGSKVRVDANDTSFVLMDADSGTLQIVNTKDHKVMEMSKEQMKAATDRIATMPPGMKEQLDKLPPEKRAQVEEAFKKVPGAQQAEPRIRPLERSENIGGYKSNAFEVKTPSETVVGWITQDAKDLAKAFLTFASAEQSIRPGPKNARMLLAEKGLPMRMQTLTAGGYQLDEIIKIEPKSVGAEQFKIPPGYIKTNADGMFGGTKPK